MQRKPPGRIAALFLLALLRVSLLGFTYLPLLDDHIQYHNYSRLLGSLPQAIRHLGLLAARPLAGVLDIAFWSHFWDGLFWAVALLSLLLAGSALLFESLFEALFGPCPWFAVLYLLTPVSFEATYWLSAATRILPGLLLAAAAGHCALRAAEQPVWMLGALPCCLLAACFYEQCFVLAAAVTALVALVRVRRPLPLLGGVALPCLAFLCYSVLTAAAGPSPLYGGRTEYLLPFVDPNYVSLHLPEVLRQVGTVLSAAVLLPVRALCRFPGVLTAHL
ncbi:MAG: hypothetical protein IJC43_10300, partial [Clostridia bacterium]|nr:hypothetical protein [Clostridia bacterium]